MHEPVGAPAWVMLAYLVAGACFILALRGLSNPESARRGNRFGMAGMLLAVATTLGVWLMVTLGLAAPTAALAQEEAAAEEASTPGWFRIDTDGLGTQFWVSQVLADRFGVSWMVIVEPES